MKEVITHQMVADKLAAYLQHDLSLDGLVAWAESAMMEGNSTLNISPLSAMSWHALVWPTSVPSV